MRSLLLVLLGVCIGAPMAWILSRTNVDLPILLSGSQDAQPVLQAEGDSEAELISLTVRARTTPQEAFLEALTLDSSSMRARTLRQAAKIWARESPQDALIEAADLPDELRALIESTIAEEWAFVDPAGFLAYAESVASIDQILAGLRVLLATAPERVWTIADRYTGPGNSAATDLYLSAVRAMAGRDPRGTIARFQSLASGQQRDPILTSIAEGYADLDSEAALSWVMSVQPLSREAASTVIRAIAVKDPIRAYDVLRESTNAGLTVESMRWELARAVLEARQDTASVATALVRRYGSELGDPLVSALLNAWVRESAEDAMTWLSTNRASVTAASVTTMVSSLAFDDVWLAASLADRVPPEFQSQWLLQTANRYGQFDSGAAVEWVAQFEARPDHAQLVNQVVLGAAAGNPGFAAAFIESTDYAIDSNIVNFAGDFFATRDPRAAADWALRLTESDAFAPAIEGVAGSWLRSDPAAAQQWALETPSGESRDMIIDALFTYGTDLPLDSKTLIESFSSDAVADRSIGEYVERVARQPSFYGDAGIIRAQQMIEMVTDSGLRREAEERIEEVR